MVYILSSNGGAWGRSDSDEKTIVSFGQKNLVFESPVEADKHQKLDAKLLHKLLKTFSEEQPLKVLVKMKDVDADQAVASIRSSNLKKKDKAKQVNQHLRDSARIKQADVLAMIENRRRSGKVKKYKKFWLVNMLAVEASKEVIQELALRLDVERVYEDIPIEPPRPAIASQNLSLNDMVISGKAWGLDKILVNDYWTRQIDGTGIVIGSIDSGVDMTHPDLAGKMAFTGSGLKGWFDANANAAQPVDTDGHGTHTIGIMVGGHGNASGIEIGVAPGAKFYAARVFGPNVTTASVILAAAEWMLDPDDNPATDDAPQVINNSWGSTLTGDTSEWFRTMVQNWRAAGIVPVFSSGNSGPEYKAASSPGNYPESFCVGATTPEDRIAEFSSKGPVVYGGTEIIKPDICAPGSYVVSALASGTDMYGDSSHKIGSDLYWSNGTSMAAPHIAGACALILQAHPDWTPDRVEAVLMGASSDIGAGSLAQGAGRVDLASTRTAQLIADPPLIHFGTLDAASTSCCGSKSISVTGLNGASGHYSVSLAGVMPAGVSSAITPSSFALAAGETTSLSLTLNIDVQNAAVPLTTPYSYEQAIVIRGASVPDARVPFAVRNPAYVTVAFSGQVLDKTVVLHDRERWGEMMRGRSEAALSFEVPHLGTYDAWVLPGPAKGIIVKEGIAVQQSRTSVMIDLSEVVHSLRLDPKNEMNYPVVTSRSYQEFVFKHKVFPTSLGISYSYFTDPIVFQISNVSDQYSIEYKFQALQDGKYYSVTGAEDQGITASRSLRTEPGDYAHFKMRFSLPPIFSDKRVWLNLSNGVVRNKLDPPYIQDVYLTPASNGHIFAEYMDLTSENFCYSPLGSEIFDCFEINRMPPFLALSRDTIGYLKPSDQGTEVMPYRPGDAEPQMEVGKGPYYFAARFKNAPTAIKIDPTRSKLYLSQTDDLSYGPKTSGGVLVGRWPAFLNDSYFLYQNGALLKTGKNIDWWLQKIDIAPGAYTIKFPYSANFVGTRIGAAEATLTFDTRKDDRDPPYIHSFQLLTDGKISDKFIIGYPSEVHFVVRDAEQLANVSLAYWNGNNWVTLSLSYHGEKAVASLPAYVAALKLKLDVADASGNTLSYIADPAIVGNSDMTPPTAPIVSDGGQTEYSSTRLSATWMPSSDPESGIAEYLYRIVRDTAMGLPVTEWASAGTNTSISVTGLRLSHGTIYYFQIQARNGEGLFATGFSDGITVILPADLYFSEGVRAEGPAVAGTSQTGRPFKAYEGQSFAFSTRIRNNGPAPTPSGTVTFTLFAWISGQATLYSVNAVLPALAAGSDAAVRSATWTAINPGPTAYHMIATIDPDGLIRESTKSNNYWEVIGFLNVLTDSTPPSTPLVTDQGAYTASVTQLSATWTSSDAETGISEYRYRITQDSATGSLVRDWTSTQTASAVATGLSLTAGKRYFFTVQARNGVGAWSASGNSDGIGAGADLESPTIPQNFRVTAKTYATVSLRWDPCTDIGGNRVGYRIYRDGVVLPMTTTSTSAVDNFGVRPDTTYIYRAQAYDSSPSRNRSALSNPVTVATPSAPLPAASPNPML